MRLRELHCDRLEGHRSGERQLAVSIRAELIGRRQAVYDARSVGDRLTSLAKGYTDLNAGDLRSEAILRADLHRQPLAFRLENVEDIARTKHVPVDPSHAQIAVLRVIPHRIRVEAHLGGELRQMIALANYVGNHAPTRHDHSPDRSAALQHSKLLARPKQVNARAAANGCCYP